ncbi:hypothetical protein BDN72DRAFT_958445 [Pluteus cervinus]|uniref:Uncharacterized protein n=1 Tax=Pluteus cervinus TaxID=181527 RepID=A0ACD3B127_9AGAR|nr:hypothetical protein BDN72DRAFT_958445 [Pluteus cervinus]
MYLSTLSVARQSSCLRLSGLYASRGHGSLSATLEPDSSLARTSPRRGRPPKALKPTLPKTPEAPSEHGLNSSLLEALRLRKQKEENSSQRDGSQLRVLTRAIRIVGSLDYALSSSKQTASMKGVGPGVTECIARFLGEEVPVREGQHHHSKSSVIHELEGIPGIGKTRARALAEAGCHGVWDLRRPKFQDMLSASQRVMFLYEEDLKQPVSRQESEAVQNFFKHNLPKGYLVEIVEPFDSDESASSIRILVHHPDHTDIPSPNAPEPERHSMDKLPKRTSKFFSGSLPLKARATNEFYQDVVEMMQNKGLLVSTKAVGERRWEGIIRVPNESEEDWQRVKAIRSHAGVYRRLEIHLAPHRSVGAALTALSSSPKFYHGLQERAYSIGHHLDEFGLWEWKDGSDSSAEAAGGGWVLTQAQSEEDILVTLGVIMRSESESSTSPHP